MQDAFEKLTLVDMVALRQDLKPAYEEAMDVIRLEKTFRQKRVLLSTTRLRAEVHLAAN